MSENVQKWDAWINMMPPGPPTLHVTGTIDVGNEVESATIVFDSLDVNGGVKFGNYFVKELRIVTLSDNDYLTPFPDLVA